MVRDTCTSAVTLCADRYVTLGLRHVNGAEQRGVPHRCQTGLLGTIATTFMVFTDVQVNFHTIVTFDLYNTAMQGFIGSQHCDFESKSNANSHLLQWQRVLGSKGQSITAWKGYVTVCAYKRDPKPTTSIIFCSKGSRSMNPAQGWYDVILQSQTH